MLDIPVLRQQDTLVLKLTVVVLNRFRVKFLHLYLGFQFSSSEEFACAGTQFLFFIFTRNHRIFFGWMNVGFLTFIHNQRDVYGFNSLMRAFENLN